MFRRLAPLLLAPLLGSCQPGEIRVHAAFLDNALAFVPAERGDWSATLCWREGIVVDDSLQPKWRFTAPGTGECKRPFPLLYGRAPAGAENAVAPRPLEPGRLYLFVGDATVSVPGAFALSRAGRGTLIHNVDPDSPAAAALLKRWRARSRAVGAR